MKIQITCIDDLVDPVQKKYPWLMIIGGVLENGDVYIEIKDLEHLVKTMNQIDKQLENNSPLDFYPFSQFFIEEDGKPVIRIYDNYAE